MKKIVASILTAIMLMVVFQTAAFAAEGEGAEANVSPNLGGERHLSRPAAWRG